MEVKTIDKNANTKKGFKKFVIGLFVVNFILSLPGFIFGMQDLIKEFYDFNLVRISIMAPFTFLLLLANFAYFRYKNHPKFALWLSAIFNCIVLVVNLFIAFIFLILVLTFGDFGSR